MSEVTLFQQEVPSYLKRAGMDDLTKSLAGNTGLKRISIRGGVFRMMVNGEEIAKNEGRAMEVVIVNGGRNIARQFYAGKYVAGESSAPDCQDLRRLPTEHQGFGSRRFPRLPLPTAIGSSVSRRY